MQSKINFCKVTNLENKLWNNYVPVEVACWFSENEFCSEILRNFCRCHQLCPSHDTINMMIDHLTLHWKPPTRTQNWYIHIENEKAITFHLIQFQFIRRRKRITWMFRWLSWQTIFLLIFFFFVGLSGCHMISCVMCTLYRIGIFTWETFCKHESGAIICATAYLCCIKKPDSNLLSTKWNVNMILDSIAYTVVNGIRT